MGPASKRQGPLFGREPKESSRALCRTLFWEEPEKQRAAVPQDAGKNPERVPESTENTWHWSDINVKETTIEGIQFHGTLHSMESLDRRRSLTKRNQRIPERQQLRTAILRSPCNRGLKLDGVGEWLVQDIVSAETPCRASHQANTAMNRYVIQQLDQVGS